MRLIDPKAKTNLLYVSDMAFEQMQKIPTIDAEAVVRCGECKHCNPTEGGSPLCTYHRIACSYNDFCSYGERKEDNHDKSNRR